MPQSRASCRRPARAGACWHAGGGESNQRRRLAVAVAGAGARSLCTRCVNGGLAAAGLDATGRRPHGSHVHADVSAPAGFPSAPPCISPLFVGVGYYCCYLSLRPPASPPPACSPSSAPVLPCLAPACARQSPLLPLSPPTKALHIRQTYLTRHDRFQERHGEWRRPLST